LHRWLDVDIAFLGKERGAAMNTFERGGTFAITLAVAAAFSSTVQSETAVERGGYLVNTVMACGNCHTPKDSNGLPTTGKELSGGAAFDVPPFAATAANITPDRETGIGTWSEDDIKRALIVGVRPEHARLPGAPLAAIMPANFYKALTAEDLDAVVAYLRSIPAVKNEVPSPVYKMPVMRGAYTDAEKQYTSDSLRDPATRGRYLATIGHCMECHTPMMRGTPDFANSLGKGGRVFSPTEIKGLPSTWDGSKSSNITSDPKAGLGSWTDAEIKRAITQGISRDGTPLKPPMAYASYANMTGDDLDAIVAWLRTVPPLQ
jgi:mono/diheme cytochrome c family protein